LKALLLVYDKNICITDEFKTQPRRTWKMFKGKCGKIEDKKKDAWFTVNSNSEM